MNITSYDMSISKEQKINKIENRLFDAIFLPSMLITIAIACKVFSFIYSKLVAINFTDFQFYSTMISIVFIILILNIMEYKHDLNKIN